jgi:hypothetical protein
MAIRNFDGLSEEQVKRFVEALHKPLMEGLLFGSLMSGGPLSGAVGAAAYHAERAAEQYQRDYVSKWKVEHRLIEVPSRATIKTEYEIT